MRLKDIVWYNLIIYRIIAYFKMMSTQVCSKGCGERKVAMKSLVVDDEALRVK